MIHRYSLALLLGLALAGPAATASANSESSGNSSGRGGTSMCRVSGNDAQGALQTVRIRADGSQAWQQVEETVLAECRAAYRLRNCAIVSCRP
jgi:hypothetical protein